MLDDGAMRGLHEDDQRDHIMSVQNFAACLVSGRHAVRPDLADASSIDVDEK